MSISHVEDVLSEVLTKVDDRIVKISSAGWIIALSKCLMVIGFLSSCDSEVSHIVLPTLLTNLKVSVSMNLRNVLSWDSTLSVKTVSVLRDDMLEISLVHELKHGHVALSWSCLSHSYCEISIVLSLLLLELSLFEGFLNIGCLFPASWSSWKHSVSSRPIIWDTSSCRDSGTSERHKVLGGQDHISKLLDFSVEFFWRIEVLLLSFLGFDSCICHCYYFM